MANLNLCRSYFIVRYEEAVQNPSKMIDDLSDFLGIGFDINMDEAKKHYRPINLDTWKKELSGYRFSKQTLNYIEQLGYPL